MQALGGRDENCWRLLCRIPTARASLHGVCGDGHSGGGGSDDYSGGGGGAAS